MEVQKSHSKSIVQTCLKPVKWKWTGVEQKAFVEAKRMIKKEPMLAYPKFGEVFHICPDASETQTYGVFKKNDKPFGFLVGNWSQWGQLP